MRNLQACLTYRTCSSHFGRSSQSPEGHDRICVRHEVGQVLLLRCKYTHGFTVQRVVGRASGLSLLGDKIPIDLLTGVLHALVVRRNVSVVNLWR